MKNTLKSHGKQVYRHCTASTQRGATYAIPFSLAVFVYGTMFLGGIASGAGAHVSGGSLSDLVNAVDAAQFELWMDFAKAGVLSKSVFGLLYPLVGLSFVAFEGGVHLGYTVPQLGYVVEGLNLLWPVAGLGLIGMQLIRFVELHRE